LSHIHQVGVKMQNVRYCWWAMCKCCREGVKTRIYRACE